MASSTFTGAAVPPTKKRAAGSNRTKSTENPKYVENLNPNVCSLKPRSKLHNPPPMINSWHDSENPTSRKSDLNRLASPRAREKLRERRFVIAKKKCRPRESGSSASVDCDECGNTTEKSKCLCMAYESLKASHEEFFNNRSLDQNEGDIDDENGELRLKRDRERVLEEARQSVPEPGSGRVMHLVKAFEKLLMIRKLTDSAEIEGKNENKATKWALPGLQQQTRCSSSSSKFPVTLESVGLDSRISFPSDGCQGSRSSRNSAGGRKGRPNSFESSRNVSRRQCNTKQQKAISRKSFVLTTEQRGRYKQEEFMKKLQIKLGEEEKLRMPVAQGLPKTTDEPQIPPKPPVKESTKPITLMLRTETRAMERAEFDNQVAKKMKVGEQYRMEMERRERVAEEEEIRRLRKELVPKAQPMPRFDRPFIPTRSLKDLTIPKQPKFHLPHHKKIKRNMPLNE